MRGKFHSDALRLRRSRKKQWWTGLRVIAAVFILAAAHPATAQVRLKLFGHDVVVRSFVKHAGEEIINTDVLLIDKKVTLRNRQIYILKTGSFGDTGFAVGTHTNGAMCDNHFFVLVFPANEPPRVDSKFSGCAVRYGIESDHIIFETIAASGDNASLRSRWIWTTRGFSPEQRFNIKTDAVAALLQSQSIRQPAELLEHAEFTGQIEELAQISGFSEDALFETVKGRGSVRYDGNVMFGKACQADNCALGSLLVAVDIPSKKLYLALKSGDKPAIVAPQPTAWPVEIQNELNQWTSQQGGPR